MGQIGLSHFGQKEGPESRVIQIAAKNVLCTCWIELQKYAGCYSKQKVKNMRS